jgi:hypothetical protein
VVVYCLICMGVDKVSKCFNFINWSEYIHIIFKIPLLIPEYRGTTPFVLASVSAVLDPKFENRDLWLCEKTCAVYRKSMLSGGEIDSAYSLNL